METIENIVNRYQDENGNIFRYVTNIMLSFGRDKDVIIEGVTDDDSIMEMLRHFIVNFADEGEDEESNQQIIEKMKKLIVEEKNKTSAYLDEHDKKQIPNELQNLEITNDKLGLVEYLSHNYDDMSYDDYMAHLYNMTADSLKEEIDRTLEGKSYYNEFTVDDYKMLLEYARIYHYNEHIEAVRTHEIYLSEMLNSYHVMDYKHPINIYRQSFILLLTAFDAAVFDIVEVIIREHFFDFIKENDDINESYKLKDIIQKGSFETFQESIIENILENNYAARLLKMLYKYDKNYFLIDGVDQYKDICEIIARRNLHIHKRGIIDNKYFEQAQGNPFVLICGEVAYIKGSYYLHTMEILLGFIDNFQALFEAK